MTPNTDRPFEADEADVVEQRRAITDDGDDVVLPDELSVVDADAADALDQSMAVPVDDDDWPTELSP